jgi:hypothetical protein
MRRFIMLALVCALPSALLADNTAPASAAPAIAPEKKICRRQQDTGSSIPEMICHTRAEWVAIQAANDKARRTNMTPWNNGLQAARAPGGH